MPDTLPAMENIGNEWLDIYQALSIPNGTPLVLQNTGTTTVILHVSEEQPTDDATGRHLYPLQKEWVNVGVSGLWVKSAPKSKGLTRLQVDEVGGLDKTKSGAGLFPDALNIQIPTSETPPAESTFLLVTNNSINPLEINQLVNVEGFSTGGEEGGSIMSMLFIFNPNTTGATFLPSDAKAYANSYDGQFVDTTGNDILFNVLENFNETINPDRLRVSIGPVSFFEAPQSLTILALNDSISLNQPFVIAPSQSLVIGFTNTIINSGGTSVLTTALLSGKFLSFSGRVEVLPENLTYEGDFLTSDGDQLIYGD